MREIDLSPTRRLWSTTNAAANSAPPSKNSQKRGGGQPACSSNCVGIIQQQHHPRRSKTRSGSGRAPGLSSRMSALDRERQEKIDRENRILLRKILEQHHGIRRHSSIPPSAAGGQVSFRRPRSQSQHSASSNLDLVSTGTTVTATSNQINQQKQKHKRDYENLLLLQKIQNVKPSRNIEASFGRMRLN